MIESAKRTRFLEGMTFSPRRFCVLRFYRSLSGGFGHTGKKIKKHNLFFLRLAYTNYTLPNHMVMRKHIMTAGGERVFYNEDDED